MYHVLLVTPVVFSESGIASSSCGSGSTGTGGTGKGGRMKPSFTLK